MVPDLRDADDLAHEPGPELRWSESWVFEFAAPDASLGGWVRYTAHPNQGRGSYQAFLVGEGRQLIAVLDDDVPLPATGLEIRTTGLWATHICETPFDHWTIGLEAFGLGLDDPAEIFGRQYGDQVPLGFDLEWETFGGRDPAGRTYPQACRVSGEILVGPEELDVDLVGFRDHTWGPGRVWDERWFAVRGALDDGTWFEGSVIDGDIARAGARLGGDAVPVTAVGQTMDVGLPGAAHLALGSLELTIDPVGVTPLELVDPEQRRTRSPRALCRVAVDDDRAGWAWASWNDPQVPTG